MQRLQITSVINGIAEIVHAANQIFFGRLFHKKYLLLATGSFGSFQARTIVSSSGLQIASVINGIAEIIHAANQIFFGRLLHNKYLLLAAGSFGSFQARTIVSSSGLQIASVINGIAEIVHAANQIFLGSLLHNKYLLSCRPETQAGTGPAAFGLRCSSGFITIQFTCSKSLLKGTCLQVA